MWRPGAGVQGASMATASMASGAHVPRPLDEILASHAWTAWWDGDHVTTVGGKINSMLDRVSPSTYLNLNQGTDAYRPTVTTLNGLGAALFSGGQQLRTDGFYDPGLSLRIFIVAGADSTVPKQLYSADSVSTLYLFGAGGTCSQETRSTGGLNQTNWLSAYPGYSAAVFRKDFNNTGVGGHIVRVNRELVCTTDDPDIVSLTETARIRLGSRFETPSLGITGPVGMMAITTYGALTDAEAHLIEKDLMALYGVPF